MMMETGKAVLKVRRQKRDKVELTGEKHTLEDRKTGYHFRDGNDIDGRLILEDIPGGRTARLILEISNTAVEENAGLEMERPVAGDLEIVLDALEIGSAFCLYQRHEGIRRLPQRVTEGKPALFQ